MANEAGDVIASLQDPLEGIAGCQVLMLEAKLVYRKNLLFLRYQS